MKITDKATKNVFVMPQVAVKYINRAKKSELKILYYLFAHAGDVCVEQACKDLEETPESFQAALAFWRCAGVLDEEETDGESCVSLPKPDQVNGANENNNVETSVGARRAPDAYTLTEIAQKREQNQEYASLLTYLEKLTEHLYNAAEQGIVLYLYDTLGMDYTVIMGVAKYCVSKGKTSIRYIEKTALNIRESGVRTYAELEAYFEAARQKEAYLGMVKRVIGIERAFTPNEKGLIDRWEKTFTSSEELVSLAYEKTVAKINKPQIAYMSKILENWHANGLKTQADVQAFLENADKPSASKTDKVKTGLAFNLDDIFEKPF